jgi:ClpP class serine protease
VKGARFTAHGILAIAAASWGLEFATVNDRPIAAPFKECGSLAVVDIHGPLLHRADEVPWWDSYEAIRTRVDAALASPLPILCLRIDSPGGVVAGCFEFADEIKSKAAAVGKRVYAYVDGMAASAAYALACAAERIFLPPTALVGSIGCIKVGVDQSRLDSAMGLTFSVASSGRRKADGNPHVPTTEEAVLAMQAEVDAMAAVFFDLVSRSRGLAVENVAGLEASMFLGAKAVSAGLADEVTTFAGLVAMGAAGTKTTAQQGAEETMDEKEKAIAALKALAAGDDEEQAKSAKAALKCMGVAEEGEEKPKDDTKSEGEDDKPKDDTKSEGEDDKPKDDDAKSKAKVASDPVLAMAAQVQSLSAWKAKREEAEERAKLMAQRPDFAPEVVALMERSPLPVVRDAVKNLPRGPRAAKGGQVAAARAAVGVTATQGDKQGEVANALPEDEARKLDEQMGLAKRTEAIRNDGNKQILGVMTPAEARAEIARRSELAKKGATQ